MTTDDDKPTPKAAAKKTAAKAPPRKRAAKKAAPPPPPEVVDDDAAPGRLATRRTEATEVLIAGAGPTGLVLALWLNRMGVKVRIIDKAPAPGMTSRALAIQGRTLELYRQMGMAEELVGEAYQMSDANLWVGGKRRAQVNLDQIGEGVSAFANMTIYPQDQHETFLIRHLEAEGVHVERRLEICDFSERGGKVHAVLKDDHGGDHTVACAYLAGCDGARSVVRHKLQVGFGGGDYAQLFYVADVEISGPVADGELHVCIDDADFLGVFPMKGTGRARLVGAVKPDASKNGAAPTWDDVVSDVLERMNITVNKVHWFSTYHVHHRVADKFRVGRAFILGDAAHIHSPVGGQGMNTGIGDAINLAWKLAAVLQDRADARLLDTYEPERIAFARRLVSTTDQVFKVVSAEGAAAEYVRAAVLPTAIPLMFGLNPVRKFLFRTVSQTGVNYHGSKLSVGGAGYVRGGDRLPWVEPTVRGGEDNFTPLNGRDWQVHVYGEAPADLWDACVERRIVLHAFPWRDGMREAGFMRDAAYLVRPEGYVALADPHAAPANLNRYLDERGLRPGGV